MTTRRLAIGVVAVALGASCNRSDERASNTHEKKDNSSMEGTPGRSDSTVTSVTLTDAQVQHGGVKWAAVKMESTSGSAIVPGEIVANEDRTARLGAPARGRILSVPARPGDAVTVGETLVTLQSPDAGAAQSDVSKAEAEVSSRRAEAQYAASARARAERLLALKAIPRQDYERAMADDEHARSAVATAEAELRRARATAEQLGASANANGEIVLRSPLAGVVLARTALPGAVVDAGASLVVVTDPSALWLTVNAPEQFASLFRRGGLLRFTTAAYAADTFTAHVDAVAAGLDAETRTLSIRGVIQNANGRLKPQMLASVRVDGAGVVPAVLLPDNAVQLLKGKPTVFIARPSGKGGAAFERRDVVIGSRSNGRVAVVQGLKEGDVVVVSGAFAVKARFDKAAMPKMEM